MIYETLIMPALNVNNYANKTYYFMLRFLMLIVLFASTENDFLNNYNFSIYVWTYLFLLSHVCSFPVLF